VVPGRDDDEQDEQRIDDAEDAQPRAAAVQHEARADDERVADVHARHRRERVVERADETVVEVDLAAGDRVGDAEPGDARGRGREHEVADEREPAREQQRRPHERERVRPAAVQPEQIHAGDREVQRQVEEAEQPDRAGQRLRGVLHVALDEDVQRPFERRDVVSVADRGGAIAGDQPARRLVQAVEREHARRLDDERVPPGCTAERHPDRRRRHAVTSSSTGPSSPASW
jgi:hypothetical protein